MYLDSPVFLLQSVTSAINYQISYLFFDEIFALPFDTDISLEGNRYMWTATDQAKRRVWTEFRPNKRELLQSI